ncbi:MAG: hypothetical protein IKG39_12680 [Lachnospiraceae bacterium]|nr:hypothetical protein [Lachnospiraceae bacterium]
MKKSQFDRIIEYASNNEFGIYYANFISWATWNENNIDDKEMFNDPKIIPLLKTDHVILGLNASVVDNGENDKPSACGGFHCKHRGGRDGWLMEATKNTPFEYAYMSDVLKIKETPSNKVMRELKKNPELVEKQLRLLIHELSLLGNNLKIIVIGKDAETVLKKAVNLFNGTIQYEVIPHYARQGLKKIDFLDSFANAIEKLK